MAAKLLVVYPRPVNLKEFEHRYQTEHLPYAGARLASAGATGVTTRKVVQGPDSIFWISEVEFPDVAKLQACAASTPGQEAMQHAASISTGGAPQFLVTVDP
jgi:hypothetical protein